jgi:heme/copper-type cytochrome/quinol oxidase subunit 2
MELDPMEGIIDLHFDILFFLIFVIMFVMWMLWTILAYYNSHEVLVVKEPIGLPQIASSLVAIVKFMGALASFILYI